MYLKLQYYPINCISGRLNILCYVLYVMLCGPCYVLHVMLCRPCYVLCYAMSSMLCTLLCYVVHVMYSVMLCRLCYVHRAMQCRPCYVLYGTLYSQCHVGYYVLL